MNDDLSAIVNDLRHLEDIDPAEIADRIERLMETNSEIDRIRSLDLKSGDIVVVELKERIHPRIAKKIRDSFKEAFSDNPVLVLEEGTEIRVIRKIGE